MKNIRRVVALVLVALMLLTGCGVSPEKYGTTPAATYGNKTINLDQANFWLRLYQWQYEGYYGLLYQYYYGYTGDLWILDSGTRTQTNAQTIKETVMAELLQESILLDHVSDYKVELTDADKEKIDEVIADMHTDYAVEFFTLAGSPSDESIKSWLESRSLAIKVWDACKKSFTDVTVEDEKCDSFTVTTFTVTKKDSVAEGTVANEDLAKAILEELKKGTGTANVAEMYPDATKASATYVRSDTTNTAATYTAGKELATGESVMLDHASTDTTWVVVYCDSDHDEEATETKRAELVDAAQEEKFNEKYATWADAAPEFKVAKAYKKLKLENSYVSQTTEATTAAETTAAETTAAETTAAETTAAETTAAETTAAETTAA